MTDTSEERVTADQSQDSVAENVPESGSCFPEQVMNAKELGALYQRLGTLGATMAPASALQPLAEHPGWIYDAFGNPFALELPPDTRETETSDGERIEWTVDPQGHPACVVQRHSWCQMCGPAKTKCSLIATVRNGRWITTAGNPLASNNGLFGGTTLCAKGNATAQILYDPARIFYPMKRVGKKGEGRFVRTTWDEALTAIGAKLREVTAQWGPEAYGVLSPQAYNVLWTLGRRFLNVHGSPNYLHSGICARQRAVSKWVSIGKANPDPGQLTKTKLYVIWGANPENSAVNQGKPRKRLDAIARGTKVIDIRPLMDPLASKADIWLPIRPGTDGALALAFLHVIIGEGLYDQEFVEQWCVGFDELAAHVQPFTPAWASAITGIPEEQIYEVARLMGTLKPMGILTGNGIGDQQRDGHWCAVAINLIAAITGNLDRPGAGGAGPGGFKPLITPKKFDILTERLGASAADEEAGYYPGMAQLVAPEMPRWFQHPKNWESGPNSAYFKGLLSVLTKEPYPLRFVLGQATNPFGATRQPKTIARALAELDFYVVNDVRWNTSCDYADYVLPACTHYECSQQFAVKNGPQGTFIGLTQTLAEPMGQSRSDWDFYLGFAQACGYGEDFWEGSMDACLEEQLEGSGVSLESLRQGAPRREGLLVARSSEEEPAPTKVERYEQLFAHLPEGKVQCANALLSGKPNVEETGVLGALPCYAGPPEGLAETPELAQDYPLVLSDVHAYRTCMHSYYLETPYLKEKQPVPWVKINPRTAERFGIKDGQWVKVESPHGWVRLVAQYFEGVAPEVLMTRRGWWRDEATADLPGSGAFDGGSDSSVLYNTDPALFDPFHSAMAKQTLVRISPLETAVDELGESEVAVFGRETIGVSQQGASETAKEASHD